MLKKVGWTYKPDEFHTSSKFTDYDSEFGRCCPPWNETVKTPQIASQRWAMNGLTGEALFDELEKPIYGPSGQKFGELLPVVAKPEPATLQVSNWKKYPDVVPDYPEGTIFNLRIHIAPRNYKHYSDAIYDPFWWGVFQPEWKKDGDPDYTTVENPEYPGYLQKFTDWKNIVLQYLKPQGFYTFPGLPMIEGYKWFEDGLEIPQSADHPLATETAMTKYFLKDAPSGTWNKRAESLVSTCISKPYPLNVMYICGL